MRNPQLTVAFSTICLVAAAPSAHASGCPALPAERRSASQANDNRTPGGTLRDGVLQLRLVARAVDWHPEGPTGCALRVNAFAEEGKVAQIPGPLVRVVAGTKVQVRVRNALSTSLWLRGLQDRSTGLLDSVEVTPGATHDFEFVATTPGAWYYWAGSATSRIPVSDANGELAGALVVDPRATARPPGDRVFVMTRWSPTGTPGLQGYQLNAINGRSWPHTERLHLSVGDSAHWHVINASDELHMMHLHGFYFRVDARGDSVLSREHKLTGVTIAVRRGEWMSMAWSPERPGNWLFHCHLVAHMSADQRTDRMPGTGSSAVSAAHDGQDAAGYARHEMAGLLLGITVTPARNAAPARVAGGIGPATPLPPRALQLFADTRARVFGDRPGFGFVLQEGELPPAADSIRIPGTPLILTRGEPVRITVHNRLGKPLSVHWHGIELPSYSDGVGGWSGMGKHIAPMIAPGDSFAAQFAPPRAGTFMYHIHGETGEELAAGLYAPIVVIEPGARFDARTDRLFMIADGGPGLAKAVFINGTALPDTAEMVAGTSYRMRVINISANDAHTITLKGPEGLVRLRALARDGHDLPADQSTMEPAQFNTSAGVTMDFEFAPPSPGIYRLSATALVGGRLTDRVTTVPIRVKGP